MVVTSAIFRVKQATKRALSAQQQEVMSRVSAGSWKQYRDDQIVLLINLSFFLTLFWFVRFCFQGSLKCEFEILM